MFFSNYCLKHFIATCVFKISKNIYFSNSFDCLFSIPKYQPTHTNTHTHTQLCSKILLPLNSSYFFSFVVSSKWQTWIRMKWKRDCHILFRVGLKMTSRRHPIKQLSLYLKLDVLYREQKLWCKFPWIDLFKLKRFLSPNHIFSAPIAS